MPSVPSAPEPRGFVAVLGPDGAAPPGGVEWPRSWTSGGVWLGASGREARLARRGPLAAVADLRLDNREDLARALGRARHDDDLGLLLAAFEAWGEGAVERLDGPFSFALWDGRAGRLHYARDGMGLRPLYEAGGGRAAFASSLSTLWPYAEPGLCGGAVADHLTGRMDHAHLTFAPGVERVAAAHAGVVEGGRVRERRFWALDPAASSDGHADAHYEAAFREAFDRSVAARLGPDRKGRGPGAFLSGGLDSSSIVVTARALRPDHPLPTFSIVYDDPAADERRFVEAVADRAGVAPLRVHGDRLALLDGIDGELAAVGEPFFAPNLFLTRALYERAHATGVGAVMDGFVGDNVVGYGDLLLTELARGLRWVRLGREVAAVARRSRNPRRTALHLIRDYVVGPVVRPLQSAPPPEVHFAHPDLGVGTPRPDPSHRTVRAEHYAELSAPIISRAFEVAYAVGSAHGIEPRFPFADRQLVELCLALPAGQRLQDGQTRSVLRRAMADRLPPELRDRTGKARLGRNFAAALFERSAERLRAAVYDESSAVADVVDVPALQRAYERARQDPAARGPLALPIWRAATLATWAASGARSG